MSSYYANGDSSAGGDYKGRTAEYEARCNRGGNVDLGGGLAAVGRRMHVVYRVG